MYSAVETRSARNDDQRWRRHSAHKLVARRTGRLLETSRLFSSFAIAAAYVRLLSLSLARARVCVCVCVLSMLLLHYA